MNMHVNPVSVIDDETARIIVEHRLEVPGVVFELHSVERVTPRKIFCNSEKHAVSLALSPLPKDWYWQYLPDMRSIPAGMLNFRPAGQKLRVFPRRGRHRWLSVLIDPAYFKAVSGHAEDCVFETHPNIKGTPIEATLFRVAREMTSPGFATPTLVEALSRTFLIDLARIVIGARPAEVSQHDGLSLQQFNRINEYIENSDCYAPTISDISELPGISRRHLTRLFRMSSGQTIHAHIAEIRLRKAVDLLARTELSVKEISHKLGFSSPSGLAATFRAATGQSPSQFRHQYRAP